MYGKVCEATICLYEERRVDMVRKDRARGRDDRGRGGRLIGREGERRWRGRNGRPVEEKDK